MTYGIFDGERVIARFVAPASVSSNVPVTSTDAVSMDRYSRVVAAQRWEITARLEPLKEGAQALATELALKGLSEAVQVVVPQNYGVIRRRQGSLSKILLTNAGAKGQSWVDVPGYSGLMPRGTFVRFGNHSKVYMLVDDFSGGGGAFVFPPLREDLDSTYMYFGDDVLMECLFDRETVQGMRYRDGILMDVDEVRLVERVPRETFEAMPEIATSTVYTVAVDTNGIIMAVPGLSVQMLRAPEDGILQGSYFYGGALTPTIIYAEYVHPVPEDLKQNSNPTGGTLTVVIVYLEYSHIPSEDITNSSYPNGGTLT